MITEFPLNHLRAHVANHYSTVSPFPHLSSSAFNPHTNSNPKSNANSEQIFVGNWKRKKKVSQITKSPCDSFPWFDGVRVPFRLSKSLTDWLTYCTYVLTIFSPAKFSSSGHYCIRIVSRQLLQYLLPPPRFLFGRYCTYVCMYVCLFVSKYVSLGGSWGFLKPLHGMAWHGMTRYDNMMWNYPIWWYW